MSPSKTPVEWHRAQARQAQHAVDRNALGAPAIYKAIARNHTIAAEALDALAKAAPLLRSLVKDPDLSSANRAELVALLQLAFDGSLR